jgi:hypothetical protein
MAMKATAPTGRFNQKHHLKRLVSRDSFCRVLFAHRRRAKEGREVHKPPAQDSSEDTTNNGAQDGSNTKDQTEKALEHWSLVERDNHEHQHAASKDAGRRQAGNGTANDEDDRVRCGTTDGGADLEDDDARQESPAVKGEILAPGFFFFLFFFFLFPP